MEKPLILVVDDEPEAREVISEVVAKEYAVETASGGPEAIAKLKSGDFSVVLLDIRMPGMWGTEALKEIRELENNVEVIMLTALDDARNSWEASKHGAFDYVTKPFKNEDLLLRIKLAVERKKEKDQYKETTMFLKLKSTDPKEHQKIMDEWTEHVERKGGSRFLGPEEIKFALRKRAEDPNWHKKG